MAVNPPSATRGRNELLTALRDANEGWLPGVGKVFTVTLDPAERDILTSALSEIGPSDEYRVLHAAYEAQKARLAGAEDRIRELESAPSAIRPISEVSIPMADVISTPCWSCGKTPLDGMA